MEEIKKSQSTLSLTGLSKRRSRQISLVHHVGIEVVKTAIFIKRVFMVRTRDPCGFCMAEIGPLLYIYIPIPVANSKANPLRPLPNDQIGFNSLGFEIPYCRLQENTKFMKDIELNLFVKLKSRTVLPQVQNKGIRINKIFIIICFTCKCNRAFPSFVTILQHNSKILDLKP